MINRHLSVPDSGLTGDAAQKKQTLTPLRIGLALGGGFARGIAHAGVLKVFEERNIPIHCVAGVSAGSLAAAAFASGVSAAEIAHISSSMRFGDVARWTFSRMGLVGNERMAVFLRKLLKSFRFEDMRIPLGVVATATSFERIRSPTL